MAFRLSTFFQIAALVLLATAMMPYQGIAQPRQPIALFDGETFAGWEGNLDWFRIEDGALVAGRLDGPVPRNEFLCTVADYADFKIGRAHV